MSLNGNDNDVKSYLFASGYVSSYLESQTLQQFTGVKSVSTAEVFRQCNANGIELKMISEKNKDIIDTLQINAEDKAVITQKVEAGYLVVVPTKNITINEWTGTAYIVQSNDGTSNTFIITGDKNGGYSTEDIVAYMTIATIGSSVDMYCMVFGFVSIISAILSAPLTPITAVAAIAVTVVFAYLVEIWVADYQTTCDLYFRALDGDTDAANKLNGRAFVATGFMFFDFATGGLSGSRSAGPDDIPVLNGRKTNLVNKGCADDVVDDIFNMKNADLCSDELLESIAKSGKSADVINTLSKYSDDVIENLNKSADKDVVVSLIAKYGDEAVSVSAKGSSDTLKAIANLSDEVAESFFKTAGKNSDELISAINKSSNIDEAVSFVSKYADDGAEIFLRHGDDAIAAVNGCDAPYKAVQIIKNGGLQYGEQAVQAIKKSSNKAVEALTKVPTKECAELIATHGDDVVDVIIDYADGAVNALTRNSKKVNKCVSLITSAGDEATAQEIVKALNRIDYNGKWASLIDEGFKKNWASAVNKVSVGREDELCDFLRNLKSSAPVEGNSANVNKGLAAKKIAQYEKGLETLAKGGQSIENCAEVWASRNAILNGANFDDLAFRAASVENNQFAFPCENCQHTFSGLIVIQ